MIPRAFRRAVEQVMAQHVFAVAVYRTAAQSIATATDTSIQFDNEHYDTADMHDNAVNNTRLICKKDGVYHIEACVSFDAHSTGTRYILFRLNGTTEIARHIHSQQDSPAIHVLSLGRHYMLSVGDYVELRAYQASGGDLNVRVLSSGNASPTFSMALVG